MQAQTFSLALKTRHPCPASATQTRLPPYLIHLALSQLTRAFRLSPSHLESAGRGCDGRDCLSPHHRPRGDRPWLTHRVWTGGSIPQLHPTDTAPRISQEDHRSLPLLLKLCWEGKSRPQPAPSSVFLSVPSSVLQTSILGEETVSQDYLPEGTPLSQWITESAFLSCAILFSRL